MLQRPCLLQMIRRLLELVPAESEPGQLAMDQTLNVLAPHPALQCRPQLLGSRRFVVLACSTPPEGRRRWTMKLLAERFVELSVVTSLSVEVHVDVASGRPDQQRGGVSAAWGSALAEGQLRAPERDGQTVRGAGYPPGDHHGRNAAAAGAERVGVSRRRVQRLTHRDRRSVAPALATGLNGYAGSCSRSRRQTSPAARSRRESVSTR
jgi:hypothetical protein